MHIPIVYLNGEFLSEGNAFIPITDRGFLFGDGVFTTLKVNEGHPEFLELHLQRLEQQCDMLAIVPQKFSHEIIYDLITKNHAEKGVWRLKIIVSGGIDSDLNIERRTTGQLLITLKPYASCVTPCRLVSYPFPVCQPLAKVKSLAYFDRLWIADYAVKQGYDEALVLDCKENVLESSFSNLFWREGKNIFFPDSSLPLMQGITLQVLLVALENIEFNLCPVQSTLKDIPATAQLYLCNSMKGVVPVVSIDSRTFERDMAFETILQDAYLESICSAD